MKWTVLLATLWGRLIACPADGSPSARPTRLFEAVEPHMGTLFRIKLYAADEQQAAGAFRATFARIRELDAALSDYKPDSELNRVCRSGIPVRISADLFCVLAASQRLAEQTHGAFDVTLGPVIRLWREARKANRLPDSAELKKAGDRSGYRKLHLDQVGRTVTLDRADMQLDLGGIAKGYAADAALAVLAQLGIRSALVAASGDLAFGDPPPGQRGWRIGVDSFVLELSHAAVSTSGAGEQHLNANGKRYSHIIDPASLMGVSSNITVTIVAPQGLVADSLATAVSVLGPNRGPEFIEKQTSAAALVVTAEGDRIQSSLFQQLAKESVPSSFPHATKSGIRPVLSDE